MTPATTAPAFLKRLLPLLLLSLPLVCCGQATSIIDYGSDWKYLLGVAEASSPDPTAWRAPGFAETGWSSGQAPLGYANPANSPAEYNLVTLLPSSQEGNYLSVFFRKKFTVSNPAQVSQLTLNINVDDGFIVWINTNMVARYNVPEGELPYNATASSANEPTLVSTNLAENVSSLLVPGENVLAVQVFNGNSSSSDLLFDAALASDLDQTPPVVIDTTPAPGGLVRELQTIEIVFSENVQGVDRSDLRINGVSASGLSVISPRDYAFSFPQPATGVVQVAWAQIHGITDIASIPNPFVGGNWTYTLDPNRPLDSVVISEFMADNQNGIRDENGTRSDWIELLNMGTETVNLAGCFLSDSTNNLTKWKLPGIYLDPKEYLLIWASAKDRTNVPGQLHTNFKLEKAGAYLALVGPATNVLSDFFPKYPDQQADISFGRSVADPQVTGYFTTPTPGNQNSISGAGFAPEPVFSRAGGVITNATVVVSLSASAGQIRYTLDGSAPTSTSPLYTTPLTLTTTTTVKARVYQSGLFPSAILANAYVLVDTTVANFSSKLPVMILSTSGKAIADHVPSGQPRTFASLVTVDTVRGLSSPLSQPDYLGQAEIGIRGQTSSGFPKRPYRLELQDAYRNDRDANLLGLSSGSDWVLNNPYSDKPFLQNFLALELFEKMGHYSVRRRFVEVFINTQNGRVSYPRDYAGIYVLLEKIKVGDDRVPITPLTPYDTNEPNISGGYMFKKDKDSSGDLNFYTSGGAGFSGQALKVHEPAPVDITSLQYNWLENYLQQFEKALYATNWKTATGTNHYSYYIDVDSFVDHHWIVEYTKQIDGYRLSNYMQKDRNGKVKMEPIWDWNLSFGNADYLDGYNSTGWYYTQLGDNDHIWLRRLMSGTTSATGTTGDPDFNQRIADRWDELRTSVFASSNVLARVNELTNLLSEAANRDFQKWPRLGTYVWPNPNFYVTPTTYGGIIAAMKNWIQGRYNWIDSQFLRAPTLSHPGGRVPPGFSLAISGTASVYYSLDGSDPRAPGGGVAANALLYSGPVTITKNSGIVARVRSGTRWSGPTGGTFVVEPTPLLVTEIMYHPTAAPLGSTFDTEDFEFIELMNNGSVLLELKGFKLVDGVEFTFPAYALSPGARVLVVANQLAFSSRYGNGLPIAGEYIGRLDNSGERLSGITAHGEVVFDFAYKDGQLPITDGAGFSLVLNDEGLSPADLAGSSSWRAGSVFNGSPALTKPAPLSFPQVVVSEALTRTTDPGASRVELQNLSSGPADISGWFLTDNFDKPAKFRIPSGTVIPPGQFVVFTGTDFSQSANAVIPFTLNPLGEEIYLFSGGAGTNLTGYVHGFDYGTEKTNVTFGRYVNSQGREYFVAQSASTLVGSNTLPLVPPVVISEVQYRPPDVFANGSFWNNSEDEYIELHNRTDLPLALYDTVYPTNTWKISGTVDFQFPSGIGIPPKGYILMVNFDPMPNPSQLAAFRQKYSVPAQVAIIGPYSGSLDNAESTVKLSMPDAPEPDGEIPYILAEQVHFSDAAPWPSGADGLGYALSRREPTQFGNDPKNWVATPPTAGAPNKLGPLPEIVRQPSSQLVLVSQTMTLSVQAQGQTPLTYQWRINGENLSGATGATFVLTNAQISYSGEYEVVVMDSNGATTSEAASVMVGEDHDGDGMEDNWEFAYDFNPYDATDAVLDPDWDTLSNLAEYIAGTNPRDPSSSLRIEQISANSQRAVVSFNAVANRSYTVQYTDQVSPSIWLNLGDIDPRSTNFIASIVDPTAQGSRYYRLVTPVQP